GKKARRRHGEHPEGGAKGGDKVSDSSPGTSGEESGAVGFFADDGDAGLTDVGTDRKLATDGGAGGRDGVETKNGEGTTAAQAKTPQEMRAATDIKSAAAFGTTTVLAFASNSTAASVPRDAVTNTAAAVATAAAAAKSAANTAGAAGNPTASSVPSWAHRGAAAAAAESSMNSATPSTAAADGNKEPVAAVHPAVAPAAAGSHAASAPTQATAPLRQEDSVPPSDGHADCVAPISSIAGAEMMRVFLVRDAPSMADAAMALGAELSVGKETGLLRNALRGTGPVAVRLDGRDLGAEDGVIQTIQIAGGTPRTKVVIFDVQALMETRVGNKILGTELRCILEDAKIRKVMHDVHDHVAALARFFP
ncbi:unnamed protein product, partial [Laminaria digitata]